VTSLAFASSWSSPGSGCSSCPTGARWKCSGPVAGFLVDDIQGATLELRSAGVEILFESGVDDSGNAWVHFRAPDGNLYEFTQDPGVSRPH
jgi:catechol 2,3-dioxygenase-like lactoylglutathione lyase family enzyme